MIVSEWIAGNLKYPRGASVAVCAAIAVKMKKDPMKSSSGEHLRFMAAV
jgi:hypothetical protein